MQDRQPFHFVSVKRWDEVVQHLFQQMIAKKEVNATTSHQRAQIQAILMQNPHVGRIHVFPPLMDIHDCVSMRMGLILSQMPRLKEQVWWTKPPSTI